MEGYALALEEAGLAITSLREPLPEHGDKLDHRVPLFLWLKSAPFGSLIAPGASIPMRALETQGKGKDRRDCARQFKAAWKRFAADEANLVEFLNMKCKLR